MPQVPYTALLDPADITLIAYDASLLVDKRLKDSLANFNKVVDSCDCQLARLPIDLFEIAAGTPTLPSSRYGCYGPLRKAKYVLAPDPQDDKETFNGHILRFLYLLQSEGKLKDKFAINVIGTATY